MLTDAKKKFIEFMMSCDVLRFGDFVTKSGRRTPYFVNTGLYRTGAQIARLGDFYAACVHEMAAGEVDALFGPAYKGIPLAVVTAIALHELYGKEVRYCSNRKEVKDHGEGGAMVGYKPQDGDKIAICMTAIAS